MNEPELSNLAGSFTFPDSQNEANPLRIKLKLPQNLEMNLRSSRRASSNASGSEYHASEKSVDMGPPAVEEEEEEKPVYETTRSGRKVVKNSYAESDEFDFDFDDDVAVPKTGGRLRRGSRRLRSSEEDDDDAPRPPPRKSRRNEDFIEDDPDEEEDGERLYGAVPRRFTRSSMRANAVPPKSNGTKAPSKGSSHQPQRGRLTRNSNRVVEDDFRPHSSSPASVDAEGSLDDGCESSDRDIQPDPEPEPPEPEIEEPDDGKPYALRQRQPVNYAIPPPLEELPAPAKKTGGRNGRNGGANKGKGRGLGWSATGAELGRWMGMPADDSDSDHQTRTPRKPFGGINPYGAGAVPAGGMLPGDLAAGTPSNLGKIPDSALADADPLGVNQNVTFDEVGGLDDHIHALKEMTLLPLLYPEVFQRFNVTPPRGVLFHGPPGTGKTLLARALAASCRTGGRQISFFMRKGADCLSKWVGEAERQLRLLFEEARNSQPSIIFFDEIDGLAPVRSSKQDQIHASIVSTLLALMDGMDGRGQVVVIGATNRPDAVDPALRRPGRFDREFYFGLPGLDAREKILGIMTKKWHGWGGAEEDKEAVKEKDVQDKVKGLAKLTKGYGGADLRALCTEAALNAIQRRYPQVYKSNDRLLLKPETIGIGLRDFMISIKKLVPSSARSTSSAATPLPTQFVPLLGDTLEKVKDVIQRVLPVEKKLTALEEAEFEDVGGEEGALEREMLAQAMQTLRVYRPRVVIHGSLGMGQGYIGAAALHHLEGYHVQSLELGTLMSDSTSTIEASIVQLFVEAKRHQPSVIYIPSLLGWCAAVSETARSTVRAMLDTLAPTDPILLVAVVDGAFSDLPRDVKGWFGVTKENRVVLTSPTPSQREAFFDGLLKDIQRPPNEFADGVQRRKRILEVLPIAPPLEPKKPSAAELAVQEENDQKIITLLKYRLGPILTELKRKFKRFTKRATEEYHFDPDEINTTGMDTVTTTVIEVHQAPNGVIDLTSTTEQSTEQATQPVNGDAPPQTNGTMMEQQQSMLQLPPLYDMDLEKMQMDLFKGRYLTPQDFLDDVGKMVHNAHVRGHEDADRLYRAQAMFTATQVSVQEFDPQFKMECERMAVRERQRRDERRQEKDKDKEKNKDLPPALTTRRSARANGLQPEHTITDPVKLERRLKRQREGDSNGGDSHTSEGEGNGAMDLDVGRDAKRTRIIDEHEDDRDPLDTLNQTPGSEVRTHIVRFAPQSIEPMAPLIEVSETQYEQQPAQLPFPVHPSLVQNHPNQPHPYSDNMVVDTSPQRSFGFDLSLLNPVQGNNLFHPPPSFISDATQNRPALSADPGDPFMPQPMPPQPHFSHRANTASPMSLSNILAKGPSPPLNTLPSRMSRSPRPSRQGSRQPTPGPSNAPAREPTPMVIERSPTPPLPEFYVSGTLVDELRQLLKTRTSNLNIEQLEQLRATSLGTVWRHRKEWDRDELVRKLLRDVVEFIEEVMELNEDED